MSDILHQADQQQFVCTVDGKLSRLAYRRLDATTVDAYSTQVPPELRGQGIADKLARRFYDWTLSESERPASWSRPVVSESRSSTAQCQ